MAFGGGSSGSAALTAHTHNDALSGDGGGLSNTLTDIGGTALFPLIQDQSLIDLLDTHEATGTESTYTFTPTTPIDLADEYEEVFVIAKGKTSASLAIDFKVNGITEYHTTINNNLLGTLTGIHLGSALNAELQSATNINVGRGFNLNLHISKELVDGSSSGYNYYGFSNVSTRALTTFAGGTILNTETTISSIQLFTSASTWTAGTTINTYGLRKN